MSRTGRTTLTSSTAISSATCGPVPGEVVGGLDPVHLERSQRACELVTRQRARNFYYGLRLLPQHKRDALYAIYAWMRSADDAVDEAATVEERRRRLEEFSALSERVIVKGDVNFVSNDEDLWWLSFVHTLRSFSIEPMFFREMLAGMRDDLETFTYADEDALSRYCYRVASTVGLVCIRVWGLVDGRMRDRADELAIARGQAFQRTNILRDFAEDFDDSPRRVYLPTDSFVRYELTPEQLRSWVKPTACREMIAEQARVAREYYKQSAELEGMIEPDSRPTLWAMTSIYSGILGIIERKPQRVVGSSRIRLSGFAKTAIALRATLDGGGYRRGVACEKDDVRR